MMLRSVLLAACALAGAAEPPHADGPIVAPAPPGVRLAAIAARVRAPGGAWRDLPVHWATSLDQRPHARGGGEGFALFAHEGPVEIEATFPHPVRAAVVRPRLRGAPLGACDGAVVRLRVERPSYLVLEANHDEADLPASTLYLLGDPPEQDAPQAGAPGVRAVAPGRHAPAAATPDAAEPTVLLLPGLHEIDGGILRLPPRSRLHLCAGAVLRAKLAAEEADGLQITGRGILDGSTTLREPGDWRSMGEQAFVFLRGGSGIRIEGITIWDSPYWNIVAAGTRDLVIRDHKCVTWKVNNDGIQPRSVERLRVERAFLKCADDCIAIKTRRAVGMVSRDLAFSDLVCWNDTPGNALEIGHTSQADLLAGVRFSDIAIVRCAGKARAISMCLVDHCTVEDVRFERISVEGLDGIDIGLRIETSRYSSDDERGRIRRVVVDGYRSEDGPRGIVIAGFDDQHRVEDVLLRDLVFHAGTPRERRIADPRDLHLSERFSAGIRVE